MKKLFILLLLSFTSVYMFSQTETDEKAFIDFHDGVGFISPDSTFGMNVRFRMQNRAGYLYNEDADDHIFETTVKRTRLRFDGFISNPKLTYYLQLSFARGDLAIDQNYVHNIVRDAMIYYRFNPKFYIGFGQGKLPGNRQRVTSSGAQQFAERSIVNARFNLDRDFGLFCYFSDNLGFLHYNIKTAISTGEGRNVTSVDENMAYTARIELLPLGRFNNKGDFFEGDLEREKTPKISLGSTITKNFKTAKNNGQRGDFVFESRDITSLFVDFLLKYNGWSLSSEFAKKMVDNPITSAPLGSDLNDVIYFVGEGINTQLSYVFKNNYEVAGRFALINPENKLPLDYSLNKNEFYYSLGLTKYINKHKTKLQVNLLYLNDYMKINQSNIYKYGAVVQVEIGI
jgi:phosphate-selective porin OprO and OprP